MFNKKAAGHFCRAALWLVDANPRLRWLCGLVLESLLGLRYDGGESGCICDCEIGKDLTVSFDTSGFEAFDEAGVCHSLVPDGGVDTLSPEAAELSLTLLAVTIFILLRFTDGVLGVTEELRAESAEAFCPEKRTLAACTTGG